MNLDDQAAIARVDAHGTREVLAGFAAQCREAARLSFTGGELSGPPRAVIVAGMGGSAASGDLLSACAGDRLAVPVIVHRGYGLPALAGDRDLVVASSYSGETAEVLSAAEAAVTRGVPLVAITSGGRLGTFARERGVPRVLLPAGLQPRMALGYLFFPLLAILRAADLEVVKSSETEEALAVLDVQAAALAPARPVADNEAKTLALAIGDRLPVVYGGPTTGLVAYRWKTDLEENAKTFAAAGALPEMNHNEIEAWAGPVARGRHLVLLRDRDELPEIADRFALLRELIGGTAGGLTEIWARGGGLPARLLSLVYLGQWTSYYLALLRGVDPWTVPTLDALKARMRAAAAAR
jgi:glucose/mannose-6-phosphate isomerase